MASSIRKNLAALVISLAFMVISLPALAVDKPVIDFTALKIVTDGIRVPVGLAMDADGYIYVTDQLKGGVIKFDKFGKQIMFFKTAGIPQRVAIDLSGNVIVSEGTYVAVYNTNGIESRRLKTTTGTEFTFSFANGVGVHPISGEIYVADSLLNVVRKFTAEGVATDVVLTGMSIPTELIMTDEYITGIRKSRVFVADTGNGRVAVFSDTGTFERSLCAPGAVGPIGENQLCRTNIPQGIAVEYSGTTTPVLSRVYITDAYQSTVTAIDPNELKVSPNTYGRYLEFVGKYGSRPGDLIVPSGAVFDRANQRVVVANGYGNLTFYPLVGGQNPSGVDSVLPIFTVNPLNNNVYEPSITISGTRAGGDVKVGVKTNTAAAPGSTEYATGTWQCTISGLVEGRNDITVNASNASGALQAQTVVIYYTKSMSADFVIDKTPPVTDQTSYVFTGKIPTTVDISNPVGCTYAPIPGSPTLRTWSCNVPLASEGENIVGFTVSGSTTNAKIYRDTLQPEVALFALPEGVSTSTQVQNLTGTVSDPYLDKVTVRVNSGAVQDVALTTGILGFAAPTGVFSIPVILNEAGANTITIEATDTLSHKNTITRIITLNTAAPTISVASPADGEVVRTPAISVTGSVSPSTATCKVNNNDAIGTPWVGSVSGLTEKQFNNIIIECTNDGKTSKVKRTVFHDPAMLQIAITAPGQDRSTNATTLVVNGKVDPLTQVLMKTVNGTKSEVVINTDKTFTVPVDLSAGGTIPLSLTAVDGVGNVSATSIRTFIADRTAPVLALNYATTTPSLIAGAVEPGAAISLKHVDPAIVLNPTITMGSSTAFTAAPGLDAEGNPYDLFTLLISATDQAGNSTEITAGRPDGDCNADTYFAQDDASICLNYVVGATTPTAVRKAHCDVGPLVDGKISPNGQIDINDCILTLRRANGLEQPNWWSN